MQAREIPRALFSRNCAWWEIKSCRDHAKTLSIDSHNIVRLCFYPSHHSGIQMTVRYSHLAPKHTLAAVELLGASSPASSTGTTTSTDGVQREVELRNKFHEFLSGRFGQV
jgi:hypothetical protein